MRPRLLINSRRELAEVSYALRRAYARPERPQTKDQGPLVATVLAVLVTLTLIGAAWNNMMSNARFVRDASEPPPVILRGDLDYNGYTLKVGQHYILKAPDGTETRVVYLGEIPKGGSVPSVMQGEMYKIGAHLWVWTTLPGETKPRWVDP
jgi:hypothetical protein